MSHQTYLEHLLDGAQVKEVRKGKYCFVRLNECPAVGISDITGGIAVLIVGSWSVLVAYIDPNAGQEACITLIREICGFYWRYAEQWPWTEVDTHIVAPIYSPAYNVDYYVGLINDQLSNAGPGIEPVVRNYDFDVGENRMGQGTILVRREDPGSPSTRVYIDFQLVTS